MLIPLLGAHPDRFTGDKRLLADKAHSHNSTRKELRKRKIKHTIPERSNQISYRKSKGTTGGPTSLRRQDLLPPQHRRTRLQPAQAMARRRHPLRLTYLGGITLAAIVIHHRVRN